MRKMLINTNILLAAIFLLSPLTYGNVSAKLSSPTFSPANKYYVVDATQEIVETLTISVNIQEGVNVYGWQANILFDPNKLVVLNVKAGDFLAKNSITFNAASPEVSAQEMDDFEIGDTILCHSEEVRLNMILVFGFCWGDVPGVSGSGTVATITFGVYSGAQEPFYIDLGDPIIVNKQGEMLQEGMLEIVPAY